MRQLFALLLTLLMLLNCACASEPANPADPAMVAQLLPDYILITGIDDGDKLRLLMRTPDDVLVFVGGVRDGYGAWTLTQSTPLPEGTILGVENFTHSLGIPREAFYDAVDVTPYADGTWGVSLMYPHHAGSDLFPLRKYVIYESGQAINGQIGDHPWSDITTIDWSSLPASYEEAAAAVDPSRWAVVNNPNPHDRLHLRTGASTAAASLGKYYNRTPVRIREYGQEWCAVTVGGLDGYMMTRFLAFDADIHAVSYAGPWLDWKENLPQKRLYAAPSTTADYTLAEDTSDWLCILGVAGDFYHVWLPYTEAFFYVHMDDLWEGNG